MKRFISILFLACSLHVYGQASFSASVSKSKVATNERFQLVFTLANGGSFKDFKAPSFSDFIIAGGPSQSNNFQSINGQVTQSVSYSYVLQPRNAGKFTIGSASVKVGDKTLTSQPVVVEVYDKPVTNSTAPNDQNTSSGDVDINSYLSQNVFIKTEVTDQEIYKGEDITVTMKVCVKRNSSIYGYKILQAVQTPKYDGFYVNDIQLQDQQTTTETINGEQYDVSLVKKTILTAQKSGTLEIDPIVLDAVFGVKVQKQKKKSGDPFQDMFDDFFSDPFNSGNKEVRYSISSRPVKIKVNDLPPNPPADFNGAVGKFTMKTELNNATTKTDEPLTYRVTISGNGNLSLFEAPDLSLPPGWETYDPKMNESGGSKIFEYLLIPRSPGDFTIPAHAWSYFDPAKKQYVRLSSESYNVHVDKGEGYNAATNNYGINKEDVEMLAKDIRYINKHEPSFVKNASPFFGTPAFYILFILPVLSGAGIFIFTQRKRKLEGDVRGMKNKRANAVAKKRLSKASGFVKTNDAKSFYNETIRAFWGYLGDKLSIEQSELSKETIHGHLVSKAVQAATIHEVVEILNTCELALFAPNMVNSSLQQIYDQATSLIEKLENEIK